MESSCAIPIHNTKRFSLPISTLRPPSPSPHRSNNPSTKFPAQVYLAAPLHHSRTTWLPWHKTQQHQEEEVSSPLKRRGIVSTRGRGGGSESDKGGCGDKGDEVELRVCTNRTCRKSGSLQILELLQGIAPSNVKVEACGCLGYCGSGPNIAVLPAMIIVKYCSTPAHAARLLAIQCGVSDPDVLLQAYTLKQQGVTAFENGELVKAEQLISQAINMRPSGGLHVLHTTRSSVQLALCEGRAALYDAEIAISIAPKWPTALIQKGDAYKFLGDFEAAENAYQCALTLDPSLRRSKSFQAKVKELQSRLVPIEISP